MIGVVAKSQEEASAMILHLRMPDAIPLTYSAHPLFGNLRFDALVFTGSVTEHEAETMASMVPVKVGHVYTVNRLTTTKLDEHFDKMQRQLT